MKIRHGIYSIAAFFLGILLAVVVGYTTSTLQHDIPKQQTTTQTTRTELATSDTKKKNCGCCAKRRERLQKLIQQAQGRREAKQQTVSTSPR